jgi:diacylglycerol kinase (ATP)
MTSPQLHHPFSTHTVPSTDFYVIFNPMASRGGAARTEDAIRKTFRELGVRCELVRTERRGHAVELAARAAEDGWPAVVAVGGDGAVHEVANGLMQVAGEGQSVPMGVIPVGSGNDFIKLLKLPSHRPEAAVRQVVAAQPRSVDIGRVIRHRAGGGPAGVWYFTNGVGVGFDAQVAQHARAIQRLRGVAIYAWAVIKTLTDLRSPRIEVGVDGRQIADRPLILTTVSNGPCHGGSFWLCPNASIDDGLLDILIADARSLPNVLRLLPRVVLGKHLDQWGVEMHHGRRVSIRSEAPLPIHADGEIVADWVRELEIEILPGRLQVLA